MKLLQIRPISKSKLLAITWVWCPSCFPTNSTKSTGLYISQFNTWKRFTYVSSVPCL